MIPELRWRHCLLRMRQEANKERRAHEAWQHWQQRAMDAKLLIPKERLDALDVKRLQRIRSET